MVDVCFVRRDISTDSVGYEIQVEGRAEVIYGHPNLWGLCGNATKHGLRHNTHG